MKVLITGASGKLGLATISAMEKASHEIVALVRRTPLPSRIQSYIVDFEDTMSVEAIFQRELPDVVIHLAAIIGADCDKNINQTHAVNVSLTKELAILADKYHVDKFIFASTAAVYDQKELSPTDEYSNVNPLSVYGRTKLAAEWEIEQIAHNSKTNFVSFRIFNIYGPGFDGSLVNKLLVSREKTPVQLTGYENFYRDYVHADDVVGAMINYINTKNVSRYSVYNIASGKAISNRELVDILKADDKIPVYDIVGDNESYSWADIDRARSMIGFSPYDTILTTK